MYVSLSPALGLFLALRPLLVSCVAYLYTISIACFRRKEAIENVPPPPLSICVFSSQVPRYTRYNSLSYAVGATSANHSLRRNVQSQHRSSGSRGALSRHSHAYTHTYTRTHTLPLLAFALSLSPQDCEPARISELTLKLTSETYHPLYIGQD